MKKFFWMVAAATALFASCAKDATTDVLPAPEATEDFTATFDMSRAELEGTTVLWNAEDLITIFTKTAHNRKYQVKTLSDDQRTATFSYVTFTGNDDTKITANYAVYPYDAEATISGDVITTKINAEQAFDKTKVDLSNSLMVAKSSNLTLSFVNAGGLLRFKVAKENLPDVYELKSIKVVSANNLAGKVTIDTATDSKAVVVAEGASKSVTLTGIDATIEQEAQLFYLALPATNFAEGDKLYFTFAVNGDEQTLWEKEITLPAFELKQNAIKTISYTIKAEDEFTGLTPETEELVSVSSSEELEEAIKNAAPSVPTLIQLPAGEFELNTNIDSKKNITIVGTEATRSTGTILKAQVMVTANLTLKNLTVAGPAAANNSWASQFSKSAIAVQNAGKFTAEEVTFDMTDALTDATAVTAWWSTEDGANITVKHCVFECAGKRPIRSDASVTVEDCTFNDPYRYAVQLTSKSSTMDPEVRGVMNFFRNTIIAGTTTTNPVYGIQLEGGYGCYDLTINGAENVIDLGSTGKESAMYYCECGKVDHASIVWNTDLQPVHEEMKIHAESGLWYNGNDERGKGVFYIFNEEEFQKAANYFTGTAHTSEANPCVVELYADLDFNGMAYEPWSVMWITFNCNNHTISNVVTENNWRGGVFGYLGACKVNDLTLKNIKVSGAQVGIFAGSVEGVTTTNVKIEGENEVKYVAYSSDSYTETWGGIGAVTGIVSSSTIEAEIVSDATVLVNTNAIVTEATFQDVLTGYLEPNKGFVVLNGKLSSYVSNGEVMMNAIESGASEICLNGKVELDGTRGNFITATENLVIRALDSEAEIAGIGFTGEHQVQSMFESGNITFEGITFNVPSLSSGWAMSSNISKSANVTFKECHFTGVQCPIYLSGANAVVTIDGCTFDTTGCAIQAEVYSGNFQLGEDLIITNCDFGSCKDVLHIYDYDKDPSTEAIEAYLKANGNTFTGTCKQTCN